MEMAGNFFAEMEMAGKSGNATTLVVAPLPSPAALPRVGGWKCQKFGKTVNFRAVYSKSSQFSSQNCSGQKGNFVRKYQCFSEILLETFTVMEKILLVSPATAKEALSRRKHSNEHKVTS